MNQATPDEFDSIIKQPSPPPLTRRGPLFTRRHLVMAALAVCAMLGGVAALLFGLSRLMFLPYELAHSSDPKDYPRLLAAFQQKHGRDADFLPPSIPDGATEVSLDANTRSMLQAEPFLSLAFRLGPADAAAELARLEALEPVSSSANNRPSHLEHLSYRLIYIRDFAFTSEGSRTLANARHNPETGWFSYELTTD